MVDKVKRTFLSGHVVMADQMGFIEIQCFTEPGAQLDEGLVRGVGELSRFVRVADLNGDGVTVALVGSG